MHNDDTAIDAWLGDVELTDGQRDRFIMIWDDVTDRYPDDHESTSAALSAGLQYILGDTNPAAAGQALARANAAVVEAKAAARAVALLAVDAGVSEYALHQELGITRRTLRLWLGKA